MRSRVAFEKMAMPVLTLFLMFVFSACGNGKAVKSDPVAKDSGIIEVIAVNELPQSTQKKPRKEIAMDYHFTAYNDGTVSDLRTGLMWAAKDNGAGINWEDAKRYCTNYRGGGYADWRMPTQDELARLYDTDKSYMSDCGYDVHLTKLILLSCTAPWASETRGSGAAAFYFTDGRRLWNHKSFGTSYARALPVRSGK